MNFTIRKNEVNPSGSLDQSNDIIKKLIAELIEIKESGNILLNCNIELVFKQSNDKSEEDIENLLERYANFQKKMDNDEFILFVDKIFSLLTEKNNINITFPKNASIIDLFAEINLVFLILKIPYRIDYKDENIPITNIFGCNIRKFWVIRKDNK